MSQSLFSQSWYRIAALKPRLRSHADFHRQRFRGQVWYVVQDHISGRYHRFSPNAYQLIGLMDGTRSVDAIWQQAFETFSDAVPTQDEVVRLLAQLHAADILHCDVPPDVAELWRRSVKEQRKTLFGMVKNPMALRLPLIDPDRFLDALLPIVRLLFTWWGAVLWLLVIVAGALLAGSHWDALANNVSDQLLAVDNILIILVAYPLVKALHELGHGFAVKVWGGEVHEMGLMFLVLIPVPYVDASSATAFANKWKRAAVGAAGILVEMFLAGIAAIIWVNAEPGMVRSIAFNVMLIGGASTILFNGNPLLRFDGYYVLADAVEIPNLAGRANRYILYLIQRWLLGVSELTSPAYAAGERLWFVGYGLAAFGYRIFIMLTIALFVASEFFFIGVLLALWSMSQMLLLPALKGMKFLFTSPVLLRGRARATAVAVGFAALLAVLLFVVPVPYGTTAEGVVWMPNRSKLHAETDGVVTQIVVPPNSMVRQGEPLIVTEDPILPAEVEVVHGELAELQAEYMALRGVDLVRAEVIRQQIELTSSRLEERKRRMSSLTIRSSHNGRFILPQGERIVGQFVRRGELVAYVVDDAVRTVRVMVSQSDMDLVRRRVNGVRIRSSSNVWEEHSAFVKTETPSTSNALPSRALSTEGGGSIQLDPDDPRGRALQRMLQIELEIPSLRTGPTFGERVFVRFDHGNEPLAVRLYLQIRQLFLRRFYV